MNKSHQTPFGGMIKKQNISQKNIHGPWILWEMKIPLKNKLKLIKFYKKLISLIRNQLVKINIKC